MENNTNTELEKFNEELNDLTKNMFKDEADSNESEELLEETYEPEKETVTISEDDAPEESVLLAEKEHAPEVDEVYQQQIQQKKIAAKLKREKFQIAEQKRQIEQEALRLQQENDYLRNQQMTSSQAALYHNENSINMQKASIRESLKKAFDMSDGELVADLTSELTRLENEAQRIHNYKMQEAYTNQQLQYQNQYNQQYQNQYAEPQQVQLNDETVDWVKNNPWIIEDSNDYDEDKVNELEGYSNYINNYLIRNGRQNEILTEPYFNAIDKHMQKTFGGNTSQKPQNLSMNRAQVPVAPVRRSGSGGYGTNSSNQVTLTAGQKEMARYIEKATKGQVKASHYAAEIVKNKRKNQEAIDSGDVQYLRHHGLINN